MALKEVTTDIQQPIKRTISLRWLMILGFGGIVGLAVGLVLFISVSANFENTFSLLGSRANILINGMQRSIAAETDQAERAVRALAKAYEAGNLEIGNSQSQRPMLSALLTAIPVIESLLVFSPDGQRSGLVRLADGSFFDILFGAGSREDQEAFEKNLKRDITPQPLWGETVFINGILFHNVAIAFTRDDKLQGVAVAAIGRHSMNRVISRLGKNTDATAFVMTKDLKVVAHSQLPGAFRGKRNIELEKFPDPALREFASAKIVRRMDQNTGDDTKFYQSDSPSGRGGHVFITRSLKSIGPEPYVIGAYFTKADAGTEILRAFYSAIAGLIALLIAVLAAVFLGRRLSSPLHKIAKIADKFSRLELEGYKTLPHSRIRELDEQASAMNSMHHALTEFSRYVPRSLVKKLLHSGAEAGRSVEREVTVMFSDIVGFTQISEKLNAVETAELLNTHFDLMGKIIDANNGTVDKFIGDGIMAYWGAPDADKEHASNAIKAAEEIFIAQKKYNADQLKSGLPEVRIRIGIHTGRVVVGNIGSQQRQNYTMVGDVVNVAQRLEQLGKTLGGNPQTMVLVSSATIEKSSGCENLSTIGNHQLRGRNKLIHVYALNAIELDLEQNTLPQSHKSSA